MEGDTQRETETDRQTETERDRDRNTEREREGHLEVPRHSTVSLLVCTPQPHCMVSNLIVSPHVLVSHARAASTLGQAMKPMDKLCPSEPYTLRTLNVDNNRCSVVNADYQAITYTKCL